MQLITVRQAVEELASAKLKRGVKLALSEWQLGELIRKNVIPPGVYIRLGRHVFLERVAWEAFLKNGGGGYKYEVKPQYGPEPGTKRKPKAGQTIQ